VAGHVTYSEWLETIVTGRERAAASVARYVAEAEPDLQTGGAGKRIDRVSRTGDRLAFENS
jgi:hypothetical protein